MLKKEQFNNDEFQQSLTSKNMQNLQMIASFNKLLTTLFLVVLCKLTYIVYFLTHDLCKRTKYVLKYKKQKNIDYRVQK